MILCVEYLNINFKFQHFDPKISYGNLYFCHYRLFHLKSKCAITGTPTLVHWPKCVADSLVKISSTSPYKKYKKILLLSETISLLMGVVRCIKCASADLYWWLLVFSTNFNECCCSRVLPNFLSSNYNALGGCFDQTSGSFWSLSG